MKTIACKYLDYDENEYNENCNIEFLSSDKFAWEIRDRKGELQICQFCSTKGIINGEDSCTSKSNAKCSDFEIGEIDVVLRESKF